MAGKSHLHLSTPLYLPLLAALNVVQWRTTVLSGTAASCGLSTLVAAAKAAICRQPPLSLNAWTAPARIALGWLLGYSAALPLLYARILQLRWLQLLTNSSGMAGIVHCPDSVWTEPSQALHATLVSLGWKILRNLHASIPATSGCFHRRIPGYLKGRRRWLAAWLPDTEETMLLHILDAYSRTHCELATLRLALELSRRRA